MNSLTQRLKAVQTRITKAAILSQRNVDSIQLLAVSKTQPAEAVIQAAQAGQVHFGENYLQDALPKIAALKEQGFALEWHYIGSIQSNKTRAITENFQWVHSVDRLKIAQRLNEQRPTDMPALKVCIQVNIGNESQKAGVLPEELNNLAAAIMQLPQLELHGLMAIPPASNNNEQQRATFAAVRELFEKLPTCTTLDTLSMGMSKDLEAAIIEGSTLVRIGTAIFGKRN